MYPINQMWYMYAISIITLCAPLLQKQNAKKVLIVALMLKGMMCIPACNKAVPVPFNYLADNLLWYVMGSLWAYMKIDIEKSVAFVMVAVFFVINTIAFVVDVENLGCNAFLTFAGVVASVGVFYSTASNKNKISFVWKMIAKHMLPIYLLHTICAAGIRIILLRLNITSGGIHLLMGLLFSFVIPIICGEVANRIKILNFCFYPTKTILNMKK